jgi:hypothetical protein
MNRKTIYYVYQRYGCGYMVKPSVGTMATIACTPSVIGVRQPLRHGLALHNDAIRRHNACVGMTLVMVVRMRLLAAA